jgi:hypothetical protein
MKYWFFLLSFISSRDFSAKCGRQNYSTCSICHYKRGPGWLSRYSYSLRSGRSGESNPSGAVQTGPGTHPASCTMVPVLFPGVKRPGRGVNYAQSSSAEVKDRVELYLFPLWDFMTCSRHNLHFTIINIVGTASWRETGKWNWCAFLSDFWEDTKMIIFIFHFTYIITLY